MSVGLREVIMGLMDLKPLGMCVSGFKGGNHGKVGSKSISHVCQWA